MTTKVVALADYAKDVDILAGRSRGEDVRRRENLNEADREGLSVAIEIPDSVLLVTSSFFLGLLEQSIHELGETEFRKRYSMRGRDAQATMDNGIRTALLMGMRFKPVRQG